MPLQATSGAASYDAFGGGVPVVPKYIEDAFSCFLYSGTSANQIITNGINLSTDGGLAWIKRRSSVTAHALFDTNRGVQKYLQSNTTDAEGTASTSLTAFFTDGFRVGADSLVNEAGETYVSWTLKKQPKFFDIVTWTGDGVAGRSIPHNLGSTPGCILVKRVSGGFGEDWQVYHRSLSAGQNLVLNTTAAATTQTPNAFGTVDSTGFQLPNSGAGNSSGYPYVAYLFAHNAGGFGLTGTDNVISCGSWTANTDVNLGYEPQWILYRNAATLDNWKIVDNMRGFSNTDGTFTAQAVLNPNTSGAEGTASGVFPTATGFTTGLGSGTFIYIAIRRGPMRTPTTGTSVFDVDRQLGGGTVTTGFPVDMTINRQPSIDSFTSVFDRLRGASRTSYNILYTNSTQAADVSTGAGLGYDNNTGFVDAFFGSSFQNIYWNFRRAPGFFDEVCYTGTGTSGQTYAHNLGVAPELMIVKRRDAVNSWAVYSSALASSEYLELNSTAAKATGVNRFNGTAPTSSVFTVGNSTPTNASGGTYVNYLFASCPGVSKVFNYTGNGSSQTINCGFTGGARFVMIKRTDSTGDWYVWDTARGIVANNDPHLSLNSTAAEVTTNDTIDTDSTGFVVNQVAATNVNVSSATYIGLAIA